MPGPTPGLQSRKKIVDTLTLCLIFGKKWILSPNAMLIQATLSEAMSDPPTLIDGGGEGLR